MKAIFLSFVLFLSTLSCGTNPSSLVNDSLRELLTTMEVTHDGTLPTIIAATQKKWIRPEDKERWQVQDTLTDIQKKAVLDYGLKTGFFREVTPHFQNYDYAIILGAAVATMEKRIAYLVKIADAGIKFKQIILLSGARPLDPKVDTIIEGCKTEGDAMEFLWKAQPLSQKISWKHLQHPMITTADNKVRRPTTADTFQQWLTTNPVPGRSLMISNQPYCIYQQLVAEGIVPKEFMYETVGPSTDPSMQNPVIILDTYARCLYMLGKCK